MQQHLLDGRTAIVTGASKGIGRAIAELFAEEGANVVLTARGEQLLGETVDEIAAAGGRAIGLVADSSDPEAPRRVFERAIDEFGQVDIMVNNAGSGDMVAIEEATDEHFAQIVELNLSGVFRYCREAVNHFLPRGSGAIVNVSSVNGTLPICGVAYTSTKGAVNTMTKNIAIRLSGTGIRCNAIAPGVTDTDAAAAWAAGEQEGGSVMLEFSDKYVNLSVPITRPIDQAYAALYLASDMGAAVTGPSSRSTTAPSCEPGAAHRPSTRHPRRSEMTQATTEILTRDTQTEVDGPADFFTGRATIRAMFARDEPSRLTGAIVTFQPGARTNWHTHPLGQTLVVTDGVGWTQVEGGPVQEFAAGDILLCPADQRHWHGATPNAPMTHIAIQETLDGTNVTWMEPVTDEQYHAGTS